MSILTQELNVPAGHTSLHAPIRRACESRTASVLSKFLFEWNFCYLSSIKDKQTQTKMKKLFTTAIIVLCSIVANAQTVASADSRTVVAPPNHKTERGVSYTFFDSRTLVQMPKLKKTYNGEIVAITSPNKDTLYLVDDDLGRLIANVWETDPKPSIYGKKPVIIFVKEFPTPGTINTNKNGTKKKTKN